MITNIGRLTLMACTAAANALHSGYEMYQSALETAAAACSYIKLLRLVRLLRQGNAVVLVEPYTGRAAASILAMLALALLLLHVMACLFHWIAAVQLPGAPSGGGVPGSAPFWLSELTWIESAGLQGAPTLPRWIFPALQPFGFACKRVIDLG